MMKPLRSRRKQSPVRSFNGSFSQKSQNQEREKYEAIQWDTTRDDRDGKVPWKMNVVFFSNLTSPNLTLKLSKQPRILSKYIRIFLEVYSQSCRNSLAYLSRYCHHLSKQYRIGVDVKFCRAKLPIPFSEAMPIPCQCNWWFQLQLKEFLIFGPMHAKTSSGRCDHLTNFDNFWRVGSLYLENKVCRRILPKYHSFGWY